MFKINENKKVNKKTILIVSIAIIAVIIVLMIFMNNNIGEVADGKTLKLYEILEDKKIYNFSTILDEKNKMYYSKNNKTAYVDTIYDGEESKFIVKDGNSYLLDDKNRVYYTYQNNEMDLNKIESQLEDLKNLEYTTGKEKINSKEYKYEEYEIITDFTFKYFENSEIDGAKSRFYYDGNRLVYIKTFVENYEELLKIEISYNVDSKLFEIPKDYKEG